MDQLLVVDDEANLLYSLKKGLQSDTLQVETAETAAEAIDHVRRRRPDAVILDVRLPDMSGLDAFLEIRSIDPQLPVVIVTAYTTTSTAIEAMKRGAFDYLLKPVDLSRLQEVVAKAIETSRLRESSAPFTDEEPVEPEQFVGRSPAMQQVYKAIGRVAGQDVNVLILGESGAGKEMAARAIFEHSARAGKPFLAINCAALPESLLESELFGHERGAFTGADRRRIGKFEQVDGGTIFLDEIGDMAPATQAKVLRMLQDGSFARVGSNETLRADVRVIAATNQNLPAMVEAGRFRGDLYYRLKVFTVELPALRDRPEDIPFLVERFVKTFAAELGKQVRAVSPEAMELLTSYTWPGNVRELQSAVKFAIVHAVGETISADCLPDVCRGEPRGVSVKPPEPLASASRAEEYLRSLVDFEAGDLYRKVHLDVDRALLRLVLDHVDGNQTQAAHVLGISRGTLYARLSDLGMTLGKRVLNSGDTERDA